jgi:hypothetical protein
MPILGAVSVFASHSAGAAGSPGCVFATAGPLIRFIPMLSSVAGFLRCQKEGERDLKE